MAFTATFTNPKQNYDGSGGASATVACAVSTFEHQDQTTSTCTIIIRKDVLSTYGEQAETTAANPVQVKSTVVIAKDGTTIFSGEVTAKNETQGDSNLLTVSCQGKDGVLLNTFPNYTSLQQWTIQSDFVKVTEVPLQATTNFGDFTGTTLWADPDDATGAKMYVQDSDCPADALVGGITDVATEITLSTSFQGFDARGWVKIESEWIYYDGYDNADGNYKLRNCARGELGTSNVAHADTTPVYQKTVKNIAPVGTVLENDPGTGWKRLRLDSEYSVLSELGCFLLTGAASGSYRATYSVYDIDAVLDAGSTVYSLSDVIQRMVTADAGYGGAGFNYAADCDFTHDMGGSVVTAMQDLAINRYDYDPDKNAHDAWNAIIEAIAAVGLTEQIRFWYDHQAGKFRLALLQQTTSAQTITGAKELEKNFSIDQVFSAVRVRWDKDSQTNVIDSGRAWHQEATGSGASPDIWRRITKDSPSWNWDGANETNDTAAGNFGMDLLYDQKLDSKLIGEFTHDPGGEFDFGHFWFTAGTTPDSVRLDKIQIAVNAYRAIDAAYQDTYNTAKTYAVRIDGCTDYNTSTHTGTWFDLGCYMEGSPSAESIYAEAIFEDFTEANVNAIRVVFEYMAGYKTAHSHLGIVHELAVTANQTNYVIVQTATTNPTNDPKYVVAPNTHKKIRGGVNSSSGAGCPRSVQFPGILNSEASAITVGRFYLLAMLLQYQEQFFTVEKELTTIPKLYQTITVQNESGITYEGIVKGITMTNDAGKITYGLRLWNADANVITI